MSLRSHPTRFFLTLFVALSLPLAATLYFVAGWNAWFAVLAALNLVALGIWAWDKRQAVCGGWRVPESGLHGMAALGATPASFAGMLLFRHKVNKPGFWVLYSVLAGLQVGTVFYLMGRFESA